MSTSKRPLPLLVRAKESTPPSERTGGRLINEIARKSSFAGDELIVVHRQQDNMGYSATLDGVKAYIASIKPYGILQAVDGDTSSPEMTQTITANMALLGTWNVEGPSLNQTLSASTGKATVSSAGVYSVDVSISFSGTASKTFLFEIYHDDISSSPTPTATGFKMIRKLGAAGDVGSASLTGLVSMAANDSIMIYVKSTDGGTSLTVHQSQMKVAEI